MSLDAQFLLIEGANFAKAEGERIGRESVKIHMRAAQARAAAEGVDINNLEPGMLDAVVAGLSMVYCAINETNALLRAIYSQGHGHGPECDDVPVGDTPDGSVGGMYEFDMNDPEAPEKVKKALDEIFNIVTSETGVSTETEDAPAEVNS